LTYKTITIKVKSVDYIINYKKDVLQLDELLFNESCEQVIGSALLRDGVIGNSSTIGTLREKTVHAVVKKYIEPDSSNHEIKIGQYHADIVNDKGIFEVQTGSFNNLRKKLSSMLDLQPITIVYPIPHIKMIYWIDKDTGEISKPRKSTKTGSPYFIFRELYKIKPYLNHSNIKFHIILMNVDEYRLLDGWSKDKKSGATKCDRIPTKLISEMKIESLKDYDIFIPDKLIEPFTVKDFKLATKTCIRDAQATVHILHYLGLIDRIGKKGRAYLYSRK